MKPNLYGVIQKQCAYPVYIIYYHQVSESQSSKELKHSRQRGVLDKKLSFTSFTECVKNIFKIVFKEENRKKPFKQNNSITRLYLWYSVRCWIHELCQVHHTLPLILRHVDALDWGKTGVGIPEIFELEFPLSQPGLGQLHEHLLGRSGT